MCTLWLCAAGTLRCYEILSSRRASLNFSVFNPVNLSVSFVFFIGIFTLIFIISHWHNPIWRSPHDSCIYMYTSCSAYVKQANESRIQRKYVSEEFRGFVFFFLPTAATQNDDPAILWGFPRFRFDIRITSCKQNSHSVYMFMGAPYLKRTHLFWWNECFHLISSCTISTYKNQSFYFLFFISRMHTHHIPYMDSP